jgi:branched-subunit amino acid ABC-type transport system permease component
VGTIWQGVFKGLMMRGIYVLVTLGLTIIFSIMDIVQFIMVIEALTLKEARAVET